MSMTNSNGAPAACPGEAVEIPAFAAALARALAEAGISQNQAGLSVGIPSGNMSRIMTGGRGNRDVHWPTVYRLIVGNRLDLSLFFPADLVEASAHAIQKRRARERRAQRKLERSRGA